MAELANHSILEKIMPQLHAVLEEAGCNLEGDTKGDSIAGHKTRRKGTCADA